MSEITEETVYDTEYDETLGARYKHPTNADKIRHMTDEELAKWFFTPLDELGIPCLNTICYGEEYDCIKCVVNWLKQEVHDA